MDITEKIAREICWREFGKAPPVWATKAAYWRDIDQGSRDEYMRVAKLFIWAYHNIPADLINQTVKP